jgi:hypothetical protein
VGQQGLELGIRARPGDIAAGLPQGRDPRGLQRGGAAALAYKVYRCWVSEFEQLGELDANGNGVAIQKIKLENEGWERDYDVVEPTEPTFSEPAV